MDRKGNEIMSTTTYVLNEEGRRQVLEFVRKHGNTRTVEGIEDSIDARDAWFADVDCGDNCLGHFEMPGYYTKTGNPITTTFGPECFKDVDTLASSLTLEVPEMDGAEAAERENARLLQAMEETADY